ncbi:hypothetical protein T484DRAFT_1882832, partial [Baffinella frigidus]
MAPAGEDISGAEEATRRKRLPLRFQRLARLLLRWKEEEDNVTGLPYFVNQRTGVISWTPHPVSSSAAGGVAGARQGSSGAAQPTAAEPDGAPPMVESDRQG